MRRAARMQRQMKGVRRELAAEGVDGVVGVVMDSRRYFYSAVGKMYRPMGKFLGPA
jgi:hypothetical protein